MRLKIAQILLEEAHFAHRPDFLQRQSTEPVPPSGVDIRVEMNMADDLTGGFVRLRIQSANDATAPYLFTVSYLALFQIEDDGTEAPGDLDRRLMVTGANMAFPFVRECVANLTARGRFGPSWLAPTDFNRIIAANPPQTVAVNNQ